MKRISVLLLSCLIIMSGCGGSGSSPAPPTTQEERGGFTVAYEKPLDFDHFEMFVSTTPDFNPAGWDGSVWTGSPNSLSEWNGTDKNLHSTYTASPMTVNNLVVGKTYYYKIVVVDRIGQRSTPSAEQTVKVSATASSYSWIDDFIVSPYDSTIWTDNISNSNVIFGSASPHELLITLKPSAGLVFRSKSVKCNSMEVVFDCTIPPILQYSNVDFGIFAPESGYYSARFKVKSYGQNKISCLTNSSETIVDCQYGVHHVFKIKGDSTVNKVYYYIDNVLVCTHDVAAGISLNLSQVSIEGYNDPPSTDYTMSFSSVSCIYN